MNIDEKVNQVMERIRILNEEGNALHEQSKTATMLQDKLDLQTRARNAHAKARSLMNLIPSIWEGEVCEI